MTIRQMKWEIEMKKCVVCEKIIQDINFIYCPFCGEFNSWTRKNLEELGEMKEIEN